MYNIQFMIPEEKRHYLMPTHPFLTELCALDCFVKVVATSQILTTAEE